MSIRRRFLIVLGAVLAALGGAGSAAPVDIPQGGGANNIVMVSTTGQNMTLTRASTQISQVAGETVGSTNIASASAANCTGCHSTAVAVQTVFVVGSPQFYTPGNAAVAANAGCSFCVSFAYAWQYLPQVSGPVHLTPLGQMRIQDLRDRIDAAASTPVNSFAEASALCLQLDGLTSELKSVIEGELVASGVLATGTPNEHVDVSDADINANPCV
jgi:hypothetical protein